MDKKMVFRIGVGFGVLYTFGAIGIFLFLILCANLESARLKLVIDHDGGADDAMALFMALLYEKYFEGPQVVALTTTHGNINEDQTFINTQRILGIANRRDVPIYRGSNESLVYTHRTDCFFGVDGLGDHVNVTYEPIDAKPEQGAIALIELSKKYEGELIVVSLGALTNIALAVRIDPGFIGRLSHLYIAAGNIYSDENQSPEFNAIIDVEAYYAVASCSQPDKVTAIPFSYILDNHNITMEWRETVLGAIETEMMQIQNSFEQIANVDHEYWSFLDTVAMGVVLDGTLVDKSMFTENSIILCGDLRGINTNNFTAPPNMKLALVSNDEGYKNLLIKIFSAEIS